MALGPEAAAGVLLYAEDGRREKVAEIRCLRRSQQGSVVALHAADLFLNQRLRHLRYDFPEDKPGGTGSRENVESAGDPRPSDPERSGGCEA